MTAYRYASGSITTPQQLFFAVQESIKKALDTNKVSYKGENSLKESVIAWLEDPIHNNFMDQLLQKPKWMSTFSQSSADEIVNTLKRAAMYLPLWTTYSVWPQRKASRHLTFPQTPCGIGLWTSLIKQHQARSDMGRVQRLFPAEQHLLGRISEDHLYLSGKAVLFRDCYASPVFPRQGV